MAKITLDYMEYSTDALAQATYVTNTSPVSIYPPAQSSIYVKATTELSGAYYSYFATDPTKTITGDSNSNSWLSNGNTNQRVHVDLGSPKTITKIYYENNHSVGAEITRGVKNFTFWGSNSATAFADLTYAHDTDWTQLATSQSTFDEHIAADQADPKYITVTNTTAYRYYAFKFVDNYGDAGYMGFRRVELQMLALQCYSESTIKTQGSYSLKIEAAITDSLNKTLTYTLSSPIDLSGVNLSRLDMYASRTGANIKIGLHDSGGVTTEITPNITQAGQWQTFAWDLSAVSDANKDAINSIIITIVNADAANTCYIDNFFGVPIPVVSTQATTSIGANGATGHGTITDLSGETATVRGFKYGLSQTDTWDAHEAGSFGEAAFNLLVSGLSPLTKYYIRAFATSPAGTGYGDYVDFTTITWPTLNPSTFSVQLRNRNFDLIKVLTKYITSLIWDYNRLGGCGTCTLTMTKDVATIGALFPDYDLEVWVEDITGIPQLVYRGYLDTVEPILQVSDAITLIFQGYAGQLSRVRINKTYTSTEISVIIKDIIQNYVAPDTKIIYDADSIEATDFNVDSITFDEMADSALKTLADLAGNYEWGVDSNRKFFFKASDTTIKHYVKIKQNVDQYDALDDYSAIFNRVYIKGGKVAGVVFEETVNNLESQVAYGIRTAIISNSSITTSSVAQRYGTMYMADSARIQRKATITLAKNLDFFEKNIPIGEISILNPPIKLGKKYGDADAIYNLCKYGGQEGFAIDKMEYTLLSEGTQVNINAGYARPDVALHIRRLEYEIQQLSNNS